MLDALRRIIDPDFGEDIVACGFVKDMVIDVAAGAVAFTLELTTPACPVKDQFKREANAFVGVRLQQFGQLIHTPDRRLHPESVMMGFLTLLLSVASLRLMYRQSRTTLTIPSPFHPISLSFPFSGAALGTDCRRQVEQSASQANNSGRRWPTRRPGACQARHCRVIMQRWRGQVNNFGQPGLYPCADGCQGGHI